MATKIINGYEIGESWSRANAGRSEHCKAAKDGNAYFIKRFSEPKYPVMGSSEVKARMISECVEFETKTNEIISAVKGHTGLGGNLVAPLAFFREKSTFYKVFEWIDPSKFDFEEIYRLNRKQKLEFFSIVASAVRILHNVRFVHGDIKPHNIIVYRDKNGKLRPKLVDFDDGYFEKTPPASAELLVGTPEYHSPEVFDFVVSKGIKGATELSTKSDIFSLGVLLWQIITSTKVPVVGPKKLSFGAYVSQGGAVERFIGIDDKEIALLVKSMLERDPHRRPEISRIVSSARALYRQDDGSSIVKLAPEDVEVRRSIVKRKTTRKLTGLPDTSEIRKILVKSKICVDVTRAAKSIIKRARRITDLGISISKDISSRVKKKRS